MVLEMHIHTQLKTSLDACIKDDAHDAKMDVRPLQCITYIHNANTGTMSRQYQRFAQSQDWRDNLLMHIIGYTSFVYPEEAYNTHLLDECSQMIDMHMKKIRDV